jgi:DNA-binding HxlR family transcriptional regulator
MVSSLGNTETIPRILGCMPRRTFRQYCPIARTLDVVGERWSLLIVRELLLGPKRYTDLRQALPGMWTNLLAQRLRQLESAGVIRRRELPPPAARTVYELTDRGRELEEVLLALGRWGLPFLNEPRNEPVPVATAALLGLRAFFRPEAAGDDALDERYEYEVELGGHRLTAAVRGGTLRLWSGPPDAPAATLIADPATLLDVRLGRLDPEAAVANGTLRFEGTRDGIRRLRRLFTLP